MISRGAVKEISKSRKIAEKLLSVVVKLNSRIRFFVSVRWKPFTIQYIIFECEPETKSKYESFLFDALVLSDELEGKNFLCFTFYSLPATTL